MRAATKGGMACIHPLDIEPMRLGVPCRVMAGREKRHGHHLARWCLPAADLERVQSHPTGLHHGRVVA
jgi:hypothetical protein